MIIFIAILLLNYFYNDKKIICEWRYGLYNYTKIIILIEKKITIQCIMPNFYDFYVIFKILRDLYDFYMNNINIILSISLYY